MCDSTLNLRLARLLELEPGPVPDKWRIPSSGGWWVSQLTPPGSKKPTMWGTPPLSTSWAEMGRIIAEMERREFRFNLQTVWLPWERIHWAVFHHGHEAYPACDVDIPKAVALAAVKALEAET